jgi:hypothetical protein
MATNLANWSPYSNYVQSGLVDGNYVNAAFTLLAAGPPRLSQLGGAGSVAQALNTGLGAAAGSTNGINAASTLVMPLGIIQNFSLSSTRQFSRIFEIGSERSYFISGRTVSQLGLGRVYYHGASFLRVLYAYFTDRIGGVGGAGNADVPPMYIPQALIRNPHDVVIPPGYENLFINLASDMFSQPIGMMMYMHDVNMKIPVGANYFEACYVPNHSIATDSQGVLYQEQVGLQFERIVPVHINAAQLISPYNGAVSSDGANVPSNSYGFPSF